MLLAGVEGPLALVTPVIATRVGVGLFKRLELVILKLCLWNRLGQVEWLPPTALNLLFPYNIIASLNICLRLASIKNA